MPEKKIHEDHVLGCRRLASKMLLESLSMKNVNSLFKFDDLKYEINVWMGVGKRSRSGAVVHPLTQARVKNKNKTTFTINF